MKERLIFTVPLDLLHFFFSFFIFIFFFAVEPYTPNMGKKCGRVKPLSVMAFSACHHLIVPNYCTSKNVKMLAC